MNAKTKNADSGKLVIRRIARSAALQSHTGGYWICFPYGSGPYNPGPRPFNGTPDPNDHNQICVEI